MASTYKRGFFVQEDYWLAVSELPAKSQNEVMGAITRLYFTGEDSAASLKGAAKAVFIALRERVSVARGKAQARGGEVDQRVDRSGDRKGDQRVDQRVDQTGYQNRILLAKSESESEISTYEIAKSEHLPDLGDGGRAPWAEFAGKAIERYTAVTGNPCLCPSPTVAFSLRKIHDAGYSLDDVELVCRSKQAEWRDSARMAKFIRPSTLFGDKFEEYLAAAKDDPAREVDDAAASFADAI